MPYDYRLPDDSELVPDITVARTADLGPKWIAVPPLLVVGVISPSSRRLTVLELETGGYVERAVVAADASRSSGRSR